LAKSFDTKQNATQETVAMLYIAMLTCPLIVAWPTTQFPLSSVKPSGQLRVVVELQLLQSQSLVVLLKV